MQKHKLEIHLLFLSLSLFWLSPMAWAQGVITTLAGGGDTTVDSVPATTLRLADPIDVSVDAQGNYYITELSGHRIIQIQAATQIATTIAGQSGVAGFSGDGGPATDATLNGPASTALDKNQNLYISDMTNFRIRRVNLQTGIIQTIAGTGSSGFSGDGGPATDAELGQITDLVTDGDQYLYLADQTNNRVRRIDLHTGIIQTIAGNGFFAASNLESDRAIEVGMIPVVLALDTTNHLYISDISSNRIYQVNLANETIKIHAGRYNTLGRFRGDGGPASNALFSTPTGLAVDQVGNVYISDTLNGRIRAVDATTSLITTIAGVDVDSTVAQDTRLSAPGDLVIDQNGNLIVIANGQVLQISGTFQPQAHLLTIQAITSQAEAFQGEEITIEVILNPRHHDQIDTYSLELQWFPKVIEFIEALSLSGTADTNIDTSNVTQGTLQYSSSITNQQQVLSIFKGKFRVTASSAGFTPIILSVPTLSRTTPSLDLTPDLAVLSSSLSIIDKPSALITFSPSPAEASQGQTIRITPKAALFDPENRLGAYSGTLSWDTNIAEFVGIEQTESFSQIQFNDSNKSQGIVQFNGFSVEGAENNAELAHITFRVIGEIGASGPIDLTFSNLSTSGDFKDLAGQYQIRGGTISVTEQTATASSDFTGDGVVNFSDFLLFAQQFGKTASDPDFDSNFDLDQSGVIDFADFLIFGRAFGS